jgi:hypothetical protein
MKTKIVTVLMLLGCQMAFAGSDIPATYSMDCWDKTFAYNQLKVQVDNELLKFHSSGEDLSVYQKLVEIPGNSSWGQLDVFFSIPLKDCKLSPTDSKIVTCASDLLTIEVKGHATGPNSKIDEKMNVKRAVVQIRKVDEISVWGNNTSGYELAVAENNGQGSPALVQKYFYGLTENDTGNCQLK